MLTYDPIYLLVELYTILTLELSIALVVGMFLSERASQKGGQ